MDQLVLTFGPNGKLVSFNNVHFKLIVFGAFSAYLPLISIARGLTGYPRLALDVLSHAIKLPPTALAALAE